MNTQINHAAAQQPKMHHVALAFSISYELNGTAPELLTRMLHSAVDSMMQEGGITGHTEATVEEHSYEVIALTAAEEALDEDAIAAFITEQVESGQLRIEALISTMARLALKHPAEVRKEFAERMRLHEVDVEPREVTLYVVADEGFSAENFQTALANGGFGEADAVDVAECTLDAEQAKRVAANPRDDSNLVVYEVPVSATLTPAEAKEIFETTIY